MAGVRVIVFDENEMKSYCGYMITFEKEKPRQIDCSEITDKVAKYIEIPPREAQMVVELRQEIIELDPTTMKRIAKFNLEKENEELVKQIKDNKEKIKMLESRYADFEKRLDTIKKIGADIWENGTEYKTEYECDDYDYED